MAAGGQFESNGIADSPRDFTNIGNFIPIDFSGDNG